MGYLKKVRSLINKMVERLCVIIVITMVIVVAAQVFWRYALSNSLSWSEELARYLFIWLTFLGAEVTLRRKGHVAFDSIVKLLKGMTSLIVRVLIDLIIIGFSLIVLVSGWQLVNATWNQPSPALGISMGYVYIVIPVAMAIITINTTVSMLNRICYRSKEKEDVEESEVKVMLATSKLAQK